jgi:hypothetical protein
LASVVWHLSSADDTGIWPFDPSRRSLEAWSARNYSQVRETRRNHFGRTMIAGVDFMHCLPAPADSRSGASDPVASDEAISLLVGAVYEAAPIEERGRFLEQLLQPLGVLSLFAVAGGVFASLRLRGGWESFSVRPEDLMLVRGDDVVALVDFVQQVSVDAVDGLAQLLASSPAWAGSAAGALLVTLLVRRARLRRGAMAPDSGNGAR